MKNYLYLLGALVLGAMFLSSCKQVEEKGLLKFGLELNDDAIEKSASTDPGVTAALVSIQDENGMLILDKEALELIRFGEQYITRSLELPVGHFMLTEFMLVNEDGTVLWATPREGSNLAHLVRTPLPQHFAIHPEETTSLDIQVVRVSEYTPGDFGYAEFNIEFVHRLCLQVFFNCRCPEYWNDTTPVLDASGVPILMPRFTIWCGDRMVLDDALFPGLNHYSVPAYNAYYDLMAFGFHGEPIFEGKFSKEELMEFRCDPNLPPLMIYNDPDSTVIITPEDVTEPTIEQGVFGQITMNSVWDDAGNVQDEVIPVVRDLYIFPPGVLDSIYSYAPIDCHIPFDMVHMPPLAIVRSNSSGFFQLRLEAGDYMYLVLTEEGFYVDAFISSHLPGQFTVFPEEVTRLMIHIVDCSMWM